MPMAPSPALSTTQTVITDLRFGCLNSQTESQSMLLDKPSHHIVQLNQWVLLVESMMADYSILTKKTFLLFLAK